MFDQTDGAAQGRGVGRRAAAERWAWFVATMVAGVPAEFDRERTRASGHHRAGIRTLPGSRLGAPAGECVAGVPERGIGERRQAGRQPVQHVVDACGAAAKLQIALVAVAPHGIERVREPEQQRARAAEHAEPEQRAEDGIIAVLEHRFGACTGDSGSVQLRRVAADDAGELRASADEIAGFQRCGDRLGMLGQTARPEREPQQHDVEAECEPPILGAQHHGDRHPGQDRRRPCQGPSSERRQPRAQDVLQGVRPAAETDQRVKAARFAQEAVGCDAGGKGEEQDEHRGGQGNGFGDNGRLFSEPGFYAMPHAAALMVQGTTSDAGKSTLVAGLARVLARRGVRVAPFKPQNMALNSAVTIDGGEIGRAQALQALAAGLAPHTDFNPILLKPSTDIGAQVIVHGKAVTHLSARDYHAYKPFAMRAVMASWQRLLSAYECVLVEGAGSPAEINLRERDIANMGFAEAADVPVILVADIDRGGVFAHLVGTLELLSQSEQARVKGFVINRFRGDPALLQSGLEWLEARTGRPVLGVLPYLHGLFLDAEDALADARAEKTSTRIRVIAPAYPRISNHTDLDPLRLHPEVDFRWVGPGQSMPPADLVVLPGSKSVQADLAWLRAQGWESHLQRHLRYGGKVIGICGGFQMLGTTLHDPQGVEGTPGSAPGLGWLAMHTTLECHKQLVNVTGRLTIADAAVRGYEIHMGVCAGAALDRPLIELDDGRRDGALSDDDQILGTYVHGLLDDPSALQAVLRWAGAGDIGTVDLAARREADLDRLADAVETHMAVERLVGIAGLA